eukprot:1183601-Prorocentrum_minimum.AAC.1
MFAAAGDVLVTYEGEPHAHPRPPARPPAKCSLGSVTGAVGRLSAAERAALEAEQRLTLEGAHHLKSSSAPGDGLQSGMQGVVVQGVVQGAVQGGMHGAMQVRTKSKKQSLSSEKHVSERHC